MITILCRECKIEKSLDEFHRDRNKKHGRHNICKKCRKEYDKKYQKTNKEKISVRQKQYRMDNYSRLKEWKKEYYKNNSTKVKKKVHKYRDLNLGMIRAKDALRRAEKIGRVPKWITDLHLKEIEQFHVIAAAKTKDTGIMYTVDHIIPLMGKDVSGLHVPWNMQILTLVENAKKGNKLDYIVEIEENCSR